MGLEFEAFNSGHRRKFNSRAALRMQSSISDDEEGPEKHMNSIIDRLAKIENKQSQHKPMINFISDRYKKFLSILESQRPDKIYEGIQLKLANGEIIKTMGKADFDIKIMAKYGNSEEQGIQMNGVLKRQADAFANSKNELGSTDLIKHKINTADATPIKQSPRRLPLAKQEVEDR
ncbi:unnamed protein product [Mytilus edulis]|uniref:Uncharacterized protein n=1 Tax=Mytilus edulis TaxID=6550 RepID=A0A8S3UFK6_MYTED|nr:unnamed protein product [Mytilus edulis]